MNRTGPKTWHGRPAYLPAVAGASHGRLGRANPRIQGQDGPETHRQDAGATGSEAGSTRVTHLAPSPTGALHIGNARTLGLSPEPGYWHLPLVVGPDGLRLAKRHGDSRLSYYRSRGLTRQRVLGLIGAMSGMWDGSLREADMDELLKAFDPAVVPRQPVVFTAAHDAFLLGR